MDDAEHCRACTDSNRNGQKSRQRVRAIAKQEPDDISKVQPEIVRHTRYCNWGRTPKPIGDAHPNLYDYIVDRTFLLIGSVLGFIGGSFGAFGAHALRSRLSTDLLAAFETGVRYQMYHVFAILIVAAAIGQIGNARMLVIAGWCFTAGVVLF